MQSMDIDIANKIMAVKIDNGMNTNVSTVRISGKIVYKSVHVL